ncbi:MAG: M15 family metallopeptidase [Gemmatimonadetes bacterium]|nr:M15 family metallopeptidase [Gemmatimonadota bacterium]
MHGLDTGHLVTVRDGIQLHRDVVGPLAALTAAAAREGIAIRVCSGFRGFGQQLAIWNGKATGRRALFDSAGRPIDARTLQPDALIDAILCWSALPGASRHHWGTDLDLFDAAAVAPGYEPELTTEEAGTRFGTMHGWLDANMRGFGFYRPYAADLGGVAPEPWHLSYAPLARRFLESMSVESLRAAIEPADMALKARVLERLPELFERYALRVAAS